MSSISTNDKKIVKLLVGTEFVTEATINGAGKENVPEFLMVRILAENGTMHLDDLKTRVDHPLAAVALKNLIGAELVEETNDNFSLSETAISQLT